MSSSKMNVGGLIGVVLFGGITASVFVLQFDFAKGVGGAKSIVMLAVYIGAFAGNFLWGHLVKQPD